MIELNRRYKMNEEVYIFEGFSNGLPSISKGRVCGVLEAEGVYKYIYQVETPVKAVFRFPNAIYKSIDEMKDELINLVVE